MPPIKRSDMVVLDQALEMGSGYVLDFSDRTMGEFFQEELRIDIDHTRYSVNGGSKAKRLRHFLTIEPGVIGGLVLRALWEYRKGLLLRASRADHPFMEEQFFAVVARLEGAEGGPSLTDAIERFTADETLEELVASIERDIAANKPQVALDRLHTYCMKKFAHLLKERGEDSPNPKETLNARAGRYFNPLRKAGVRPITGKIMRSTVEIFELFNSIRNGESLAHDNQLVDQAEARYIFDSVVSLLRFLKKTDGGSFGT
jgi:hypothetical protein